MQILRLKEVEVRGEEPHCRWQPRGVMNLQCYSYWRAVRNFMRRVSMDRQHLREQEKEDIKRQLSYWKDGANIERLDFNKLVETIRLRIGRRIPCNDVYEL